MKLPTAALALAAIPAAYVLAAGTLADMDADGNGLLSLTELKAAYAGLDEAGFEAIDTNGDGGVDEAELEAAIAAGRLRAAG
ncbi:MAG: EF-hand domain-containing protein [Rhodobacteraceae bacterium]|nr:EF-hand domain-containing protein [Paracoccaceae bacterium]